MNRTDTHRPSAIMPEDYAFVAFECMKIEGPSDIWIVLENRRIIKEHMERTGGTYSRHQHGGNCHICGAHCVYTALFFHKLTGSYIRTGLECADKLECYGAEAFRVSMKAALEHQAGKKKAQALLEAQGLSDAWTIYAAAATSPTNDQFTVRNIVGNLVKYGSFASDKQREFLRSVLGRITRQPQIEAQRAAEHDAAAPVPQIAGRVTVAGKVLTIKVCASSFGDVTRMLVRSSDGWKVWGSRPASLAQAGVGDEVQFTAAVSPSDRDPKFGFFSRPTQGKVIAQAAQS